MSDTTLEARLRLHGIAHPVFLVEQARTVGLDIASACAMVTDESGCLNVVGHDPGNPVNGDRYHWCTEDNYRLMRRYVADGYPSQGMGPCQLTSVGLQDAADKLGGTWVIWCNMRVGFEYLKGRIDELGEQDGFASYNGSGPAAVAYGERLMALKKEFEVVIYG